MNCYVTFLRLTPLLAACCVMLAVLSAAPAVAQNAHHHHEHVGPDDEIPDRDGKTVLVEGFNLDLNDPPSGSGVARAMAFVDDAYLHVTFGRPLKRGRIIFGGVVGFDQVWAVGAHYATELFLTEPLKVDDLELPAGAYSLFATPQEETWTLHINRVLGMHQTDRYDPEHNVMDVEVAVESMEDVTEALTIDFEQAENGVDMRITWDQTRVRLPFRSL